MFMTHQSSVAEDFKTLLESRNAETGIADVMPTDVPYQHIVTVHEVNEEGDDVIEYNGSYKLNPLANAGGRITFVNDNNSFSESILEDIKVLNEDYTLSDIADNFWCPGEKDQAFNEILTANDTQILQETDKFVVLKVGTKTMLKTIFSEDENDLPSKLRKRINAQLTLSKPDLNIRNIRMELLKPTKIKIAAKIQKFKIDMKCQMAPNDAPYIAETKTDIVGKVFGTEFRSLTKTSISHLELSY